MVSLCRWNGAGHAALGQLEGGAQIAGVSQPSSQRQIILDLARTDCGETGDRRRGGLSRSRAARAGRSGRSRSGRYTRRERRPRYRKIERSHLALSKREGLRLRYGSEPRCRHLKGLGRSDEQDSVRPERLLEISEHALLGELIEVDQNISAENHVVFGPTPGEAFLDHVPLLEIHRSADFIDQREASLLLAEVALSEGQLGAAEGVPAVHSPRRALQSPVADVESVDGESVVGESRFHQRDGDRIGLFSGRTGEAQDS